MTAERDLSDFKNLREAAMVLLLDVEESGSSDLMGVRNALARSEWGRIAPDRRFWALGHCAGDAAKFDEVQDIVHLGWNQLSEPVRDAMTLRVLDWVRGTVSGVPAEAAAPVPAAWDMDDEEEEEAQESETQAASEGTGPDSWAVEANSM